MTLCTCANRGICFACAQTDPFIESLDRGLRLIHAALTERPDLSPADASGRSVNDESNVVYLPERPGWSVKV